MYGVLFSLLWLKSVPGWPAISVSTWQLFRVGQMGCCLLFHSYSSYSRVGEGGGVGQFCLHSVTQPYTTWPRWREQGGGLHSLPLGHSAKPPALLDVHHCLTNSWQRAVNPPTSRNTMQVLHNMSVVVRNLYCVWNSYWQVTCGGNRNGWDKLIIIIMVNTQHND